MRVKRQTVLRLFVSSRPIGKSFRELTTCFWHSGASLIGCVLKTFLSKCAGVEIHSFRSHIRDHFVLEWKSTLKLVESTLKIVESTLKIVESTLKRVIQTNTLEWIPL